MKDYKNLWKQIASPQIITTNKYVESKLMKELFTD